LASGTVGGPWPTIIRRALSRRNRPGAAGRRGLGAAARETGARSGGTGGGAGRPSGSTSRAGSGSSVPSCAAGSAGSAGPAGSCRGEVGAVALGRAGRSERAAWFRRAEGRTRLFTPQILRLPKAAEPCRNGVITRSLPSPHRLVTPGVVGRTRTAQIGRAHV